MPLQPTRINDATHRIATGHDPSIRHRRLTEVLAWAASGEIRPLIAAEHPLSGLKTALEDKWNSTEVGGIVVQP